MLAWTRRAPPVRNRRLSCEIGSKPVGDDEAGIAEPRLGLAWPNQRQRMKAGTDAGLCVCSAGQAPLSPFASNKVRRPRHGLLRVQTPEFRAVSERVEFRPQAIDWRDSSNDDLPEYGGYNVRLSVACPNGTTTVSTPAGLRPGGEPARRHQLLQVLLAAGNPGHVREGGAASVAIDELVARMVATESRSPSCLCVFVCVFLPAREAAQRRAKRVG